MRSNQQPLTFMSYLNQILGLLSAAAFLLSPSAGARPSERTDIEKIRNIVVIYLENHSFDSLYGLFPGADGIANASRESTEQTDGQGKPYATLPAILDTREKPAKPDSRFPTELPNRPFEISRYVPADQKIGDLVHRFYQHQMQINGGRNDRFAAVSDAGGSPATSPIRRTTVFGSPASPC